MTPKIKTLLFILLSFLLGGAAGVLADEAGLMRWIRGGRPSAQSFRTEFHRKLALDSVQVRVVDSLLDTYWARMTTYREAMMLDRDTLRAAIRHRLSPEQQQRYDAMNREMDARSGRGRREGSR